MAAALEERLGVEAELVAGDRGEFSVYVDGRRVVKKPWLGFPKETDVVKAVQAALAVSAGPNP